MLPVTLLKHVWYCDSAPHDVVRCSTLSRTTQLVRALGFGGEPALQVAVELLRRLREVDNGRAAGSRSPREPAALAQTIRCG